MSGQSTASGVKERVCFDSVVGWSVVAATADAVAAVAAAVSVVAMAAAVVSVVVVVAVSAVVAVDYWYLLKNK